MNFLCVLDKLSFSHKWLALFQIAYVLKECVLFIDPCNLSTLDIVEYLDIDVAYFPQLHIHRLTNNVDILCALHDWTTDG